MVLKTIVAIFKAIGEAGEKFDKAGKNLWKIKISKKSVKIF